MVRRQREAMVEAARDYSAYVPRHVSEAALSVDTVLAPELAAALGRGGVQRSPAALLRLLEQEDDDGYVYSFPLLHPEFCARLIAEATSFREFSGALPSRPGRGASSALKHLGLRWLDEALLETVLKPLAPLLYPEMLEKTPLDWVHGYVASYEGPAAASAEPAMDGEDGAGGERRFGSQLNAHTDDSEITLNVGLVDGFEGGELHFRHVRGTDWEGRTEPFSYTPEPGIGLIHMGRHLHEVLPVTAGERHQLIVWARSSAMRAQQCPCCWQNFRQGQALRECVCGPAWN